MTKEFVCKYSAAEINKVVEALALPAMLQGVEEWKGSRDIGGNVAAHLAAVNGKAQALGVCQLYGDYWFGADSRSNILKGIKNARVRRAFEVATAESIRIARPVAAAEMLSFYRTFERSRMEQTPLAKAKEETPAAPVEAPAAPVETPAADSLGHAAAVDALKAERDRTAKRLRTLRARNKALRAQLAEALAMLASKAPIVSKRVKSKAA